MEVVKGIFAGLFIVLFFQHLLVYLAGRKDTSNISFALLNLGFFMFLTGILFDQVNAGLRGIVLLAGLQTALWSLLQFSFQLYDIKEYNKLSMNHIKFIKPVMIGVSLFTIVSFIINLITGMIGLFVMISFFLHLVLSLFCAVFISLLFFMNLSKTTGKQKAVFAGIIPIYISLAIALYFLIMGTFTPFVTIFGSLAVMVLLIEASFITSVNRDNKNLSEMGTNTGQNNNRELKNQDEELLEHFQAWAVDIKTPHFIIKNTLDKIERRYGISEETKTIQRQLTALAKMTRNYLQSHRTAGYYDKVALFDLSRVVDEKSSLFLGLAKKKNIKLQYKFEPDLYLEGDSRAIETIIENLIDNALKFTDLGTVEVALRKEENDAVISVSDTGAGIAEDEIEKIFKRYYTAGDPSKKGTGTGLFIVKDIVESLNGQIEVKSQLEEGSTFIITFPLYFPTENQLSRLSYNKPTEPIVNSIINPELLEIVEVDKSKKTLFFVDSNRDMLNYLFTSLQNDYNIFLFTSGEQLLNALPRLHRTNLILSDYTLEDGTGMDLLRKIRAICANIPFMLISAHELHEIREISLKEGATDYLEKDFTIEELKAKINNFISLSLNTDHLNYLPDVEPDILRKDIQKRAAYYNLSKKETDYLILFIMNKDNSEIASEMGISENTVRRHKQNVIGKLECEDRHNILRLFGYRVTK